MSESDSGSGSGGDDDGWEDEYRRSLDDDVSDEEDGGLGVSDPHTSTGSPATDTAIATAAAPPPAASKDVSSHQAGTDRNAGSHVLQALDELWTQLGEQRLSHSSWLQQLAADDTVKRSPSASLPAAPADDVLQYWLQHERERDTYGGTITSSTPIVSEQWLVCQLLLLYQRLDNALYVWSDERQKYELRQHVCTPQLSTSAVASLTSSIAEHVTLLQHVHSFVDRRCHFSSTSGHCMQAFGHSLRAYLHSHDREVWRFESDVYAATSERLTTVLALTNHMQPHVQYVRMLHSVIQQFVSQSAAASTTAEEGSRLLSILYAQYEARSLLTDDISSALSLCLLLESLTPYIEQLDEWTATGGLNGSVKNELPGRRGSHTQLVLNGSDRSADSTTTCPSFLQPVYALILCTSDNERLMATLQRQRAESSPASSSAAVISNFVPLLRLFRQSLLSFFPALRIKVTAPPSPVAAESHDSSTVVVPYGLVTAPAVESAEVNEWMDSGGPSLGLLTVVSGPLSAPSLDQPSLTHIRPAPADEPTLQPLLNPHHFPLPSSFTVVDPPSPTPSLLSVEWMHPYIAQLHEQSSTFATARPPQSIPTNSVDVVDDASLSDLVHAAVSASAFSSPLPARMMDACLLSHVRDRYTTSSHRVVRALLDECGLVSCLQSLRALYLSYDGVMTSDLLSAIRELTSSTAAAGSLARLQDIVNECAVSASSAVCSQWYKRHPIAVSSTDRSYSIFSLPSTTVSSSSSAFSRSSFPPPSVSPSSFSSLSVLLQRLSFRCAVPWPLDAIVTVEHVRQYDAVFHFILQLKCALHTLARLPALLSIRQSESAAFSVLPHPLSHAFYLLRAAVHHSIAVLHAYVLSQATGTAWNELVTAVSLSTPSATLSSPSVVQSLHSAHCRYLDRVLLVCLLAPSMAAVMSAVQRLLAVVAGVEELAGMVADYLHSTVDDWQPTALASQLVVEDDEDYAAQSVAVPIADERAEAEQRVVRRRWRMALSDGERQALHAEYDAHKDGLYARCQRRCEEVRDEYQHTVLFLLMVLGKIVHSGAQPHRQQLHLSQGGTRPEPASVLNQVSRP